MRATVLCRAATAVRQWLCFVLVAVVPGIGSADTAKGLTWLQAQVQTGGQLASVSGTATVAQSRCEVARTLLELSGPGTAPAALTAALDNAPLGETVTEVLACTQWLQQQQSQIPRTSELQSRRTATHGFAAFEGQTGPSVLDTGWALQALDSQWSSAQADPTLAWLQQQQKADGSFTLGTGSDLLTTASVLRGLQGHRKRSAAAAAIADKAASYLLARANAAGHWQSNVGVTGLVYEAVHPYSGPQPALATAVQTWLLAGQATNGAWNNNDPWTTAVALRALVLTGRTPVNPAQAALKIQFVDGRTGTPISGVQLTGTGAGNLSASSNASGQIQVQGLAPGAYTLTATATGYSTVQITATLQTGQTTDLGSVQMLVPASSTTAVISGTVRDSASGSPLAGVTISITGQAMTGTTDASGLYLVNGVVPGAITLKASRAGYFDATGQANVLAGQTVNFSPSLVPNTGSNPGGTADCRIVGTVTKAADGTPVAAATVTVSGANTATATTDASGAYVLSGLVSGDTRISVSRSGFDAAVANTRLNCSPQGNTALQYSPKLYASTQAPVDANTASLSGVVMDAGTNQPIAGAQLTVTTNTNVVRNAVSQANGRFTLSGLDGATAQLVVVASGYGGLTASYMLQPAQSIDLGQIRLRPPKVTQLTLDLQVQSVKRHTTQTDPQTLRVSGALQVQVRNAGTQVAPASVAVLAFQDSNGNSQYDPSSDTVLGQAALTAALDSGQSQTLTIDIAGLLPFRDAPIHVVVDPLGALAESDKANNLRSSAQDVLFVPQVGTFAPKEKWQWTGGGVMMSPVVGRIRDTNGDGRIDAQDTPQVVFTAYNGSYFAPSDVYVVDGSTGAQILRIRASSFGGAHSQTGLALADLDMDGVPEILAINVNGGFSVFRNDGTLKFQVTGSVPISISVADLDADGVPEILLGNTVFDNRGQLKFSLATCGVDESTYASKLFPNTAGLQIICGGQIYDSTGRQILSLPINSVFRFAVADFLSNGKPQFALVSSGSLFLSDDQGNLLWNVYLGGGQGGVPTAADLDGDGVPEIGVAGAGYYTVVKADGSILWQAVVQDYSSSSTGSTAFDFDGDGKVEIVYRDEVRLFVLDGATGKTVFSTHSGSLTGAEYPLVADVDADGHADIIVPEDAGRFFGIRVFEDANNSWVPTRSVWNQFDYSITNINDDLSVPRNPEPSWKTHNTFRLNRRMDADPRAIADITASYVRVVDMGAQPGSSITVRVGNAGSYKVPVGTPVAVYNTDPALGQPAAAALVAQGATQTVLNSGAYEDLALVPALRLSQLSAQGTVWIVVDDDGTGKRTVSDFDRSNNVAPADLGAIASSLQIAVVTDKALYGETDTAIFTATVQNAGSFARNALVRFTVLDAAGKTVDVLPLGTTANLQPAVSGPVQASWSVASVLAGDYAVRAELVTPQGVVYGSASAPFAVKAGNGSGSAGTSSLNSARVSTDRSRYSPAQTVFVDSRVANLSANLLQENLRAVTQVIAPGGQVVLTRTENIAQASPRSQRKYGYYLKPGTLAPGSYQVRIQLFGAASYKNKWGAAGLHTAKASAKAGPSEVELAASTAVFVVQDAAQAGVGITGQLSATPATVPVGASTALQLGITNNGNTAITGATVRMRVLDPASGTPVATFTQAGVNLPAGASGAYSWTWTAAGTAGSTLPVAATVDVAGTEQAVAQTTITLIGPAGPTPAQPKPVPLSWQWLLALTLLMPAASHMLGRAPGSRANANPPQK